MYKNIIIHACLILSIQYTILGQKKTMTPDVYNEWKRIENTTISHTGKYISYELSVEAGDKELYLYREDDRQTKKFARASSASFDAKSSLLLFKIHPAYDSLRVLKLKGTKSEDLPSDTLCVYDLANGEMKKFPDIQSFYQPQEWAGFTVAKTVPSKEKLTKKESKDNGSKLLIIDHTSGSVDTLQYVTDISLAKDKPGLIFISTGDDSLFLPGVYTYDFVNKEPVSIYARKGKYPQLNLSNDATLGVFIVDTDTTKNHKRPYSIFQFNMGQPPVEVAGSDSEFLPSNHQVSPHKNPFFSKDGAILYFGISPIPLEPDTTLTKDEKAVVEVWSTDDHMLYTQQKARKSRDEKRSFTYMWDTNSKKITMLESENIPNVHISDKTTPDVYFGYDNTAYLASVIWEGSTPNDIFIIDPNTGHAQLIMEGIDGNINVSPSGKLSFWFDRGEQTYYIYDRDLNSIRNLTYEIPTLLGEEDNDRPQASYPYGIAGFTLNEEFILINDHFDIWKVDISGKNPAENLTKGRSEKLVYRYIKTDPEEDYIDLSANVLLHVFDEKDKSSGYSLLSPDKSIRSLMKGPFRYSQRVWKARDSEVTVFTKESFSEYPNLYLSKGLIASGMTRISDANPQQKDYSWGNGKLYHWSGYDDGKMTGMLFTPEDFDPAKSYPLIVNFYEKSSDGLHNHRAPFAGRSTISYSYYLNKGYVIFNPDVPYEIGYPGKSAYNAVMSGVEALLEEGFIDKKRIGIHGHSWGGYQIADILTKTDLFACAESGAPVVNMTSAYGGIRWGTGMSRMFQYEKGQSRLGATLWERPDLYLENSPLFNMDKVATPVLILHNDEDSAVPWYQGIEYFVALRRLGKKAWLLNYNGEPHWPVKWPNRLDFQTRLEHFFDFYLMGRPMAPWMKQGIPEVNKGLDKGY